MSVAESLKSPWTASTAPFTTDESNPNRNPPTAPATARPITRALDAFFVDAIRPLCAAEAGGSNHCIRPQKVAGGRARGNLLFTEAVRASEGGMPYGRQVAEEE